MTKRVRVCVAAAIVGLVIGGRAERAEAVTPTISGATWNGFSFTGQRLTITGSFPSASCGQGHPGQAHTFSGSCYTVEVTCNGAMFPARITSMSGSQLTVEIPQVSSGARCGVTVLANSGSPPDLPTTPEFPIATTPSPPIEIHSTVDLGTTGGGTQHRYRLIGYFPANGNFGVDVACAGQSVIASVTSQILDQLEIQFAQASSLSKSCTFTVRRPIDQALSPTWYQRVDGPRVGANAMPPFAGAYHWGGFLPDWANRLDSPRIAVRRMRDAGLQGPVRFSLSPKQLRLVGSNYSTRYDWYDDYGHAAVDLDPGCVFDIFSVPFIPFLPYAVCSRRLQAAFDELPVFSTVFLTTMDSTSAGPTENASNFTNVTWMSQASNRAAVTSEYYQLAKQLYLSQAGSAKTFVITNWEGDNLIHCGIAYGAIYKFLTEPDPAKRIVCPSYESHRDALILWFQARQDGIAQATAEFPSAGVSVVDGIEIASYRMIHGSGLPFTPPATGADTLHGIVPHIQPAYVLYSAWETTGNGRVDQDVREISTFLAAHSPGTTFALGELGRPGQAGSTTLDPWVFREMMRAARRAADLGPLVGRAWMRFAVIWQGFLTVDENQALFSSVGAETQAFGVAYDGARTVPGSAANGEILAVREVRPGLAPCNLLRNGGWVSVPSCEAVLCDQLQSVRGGTTERYFELYGSFPGGPYALQVSCATATSVPSDASWSTGNIITPMSSLQITMWITEPSTHVEKWCRFRTVRNGSSGKVFGPVRSPANSPCNGVTLPP